MPGGDREPGPRQGRVALDALAVQKDLSEQGLGFRQALARSAEDGLGNLARVPASYAAKSSASSAS